MREGERYGVRLGVSACLLGERVRYDGGHKRDGFLTDTLIRHHVRRFGVTYLADQVSLNPHPRELMLRNHT